LLRPVPNHKTIPYDVVRLPAGLTPFGPPYKLSAWIAVNVLLPVRPAEGGWATSSS